MINQSKLNLLFDEYEKCFEDRWKNESFKWKAIKTFQDNWDINSSNFEEMFDKATKDTETLLTSTHSYPKKMICAFSRADQEYTRQMFIDLYDENQELSYRIQNFIDQSEIIKEKYDPGTWKNHFQNPATISVYLWLRFPDKYYIFKPTVYKSLAQKVDEVFVSGKGKTIDKVLACYEFYNRITDEIVKRQDICESVKRALQNNSMCYPDTYYKTLTSDFAFYAWVQTESEEYDVDSLMDILKNYKEIIPDEHDGSYELMYETINAYSTITDLSVLDYTDLDLIYLMAVITTRDSVENKKERVLSNAHLPDTEKQRLVVLIDKIWDNACSKKYSNNQLFIQKSKTSVFFGMFGTGFRSFSKNNPTDAWNKQMQEFIQMLIDIKDMTDDIEIYDRAEQVLKYPIKGMKAGSVSVILHCIKPFTFPIINGNEKMGDIFDELGITLKQKSLSETYIANCRSIKKFRDTHFSFKNYRVFDLVAREVNKTDDLFPSYSEYSDILSTNQWIEFLVEDKVDHPDAFKMLQCMYEMGGEASMLQLSERYGEKHEVYRNRGASLGVRAKKKYNIPDFYASDGKKYDFVVPFRGHEVFMGNKGNKQYSWVLRPELKEALDELLDEEELDEMLNNEQVQFDHNTILYGPPGTGKTYYTAIYAVAICEEIPVENVKTWDYSTVLEKYDELKKQDRIAFTTFHQSYGYEEFIEGIRPVINTEDEDINNVEYTIEPGVFKKFCEKAAFIVSKEEDDEWELNDNPVVWKVSLEGSGDNDTRRECMENNHIRIGWDEYGENYTKIQDYYSGGKKELNTFYNRMRVGDIVVSLYSSKEIDAIGIITGDPEWNTNYEYYKRVRKVDWIAKGLKENIVEINGGKILALSTVYKTQISIEDILNIVRRTQHKKSAPIEKKNYVFIIDEINRGNISKIFGELITLIEDTKRLGAKESMRLTLPYSGDSFGVPNNVYIIGTMNTADRSIALMDTALRRRFRFKEMMPEPEVLSGLIIKDGKFELNLERMLETINERVECLYDREHTIGHAFFTGFKNDLELSVDNLAKIFEKSVIPLLQDYFYEDYEKIRLVLGDNAKKEELQFITEIRNDSKVFRGNVTDIDYPEYRYKLNDEALKDIRSYIEIIEEIKE